MRSGDSLSSFDEIQLLWSSFDDIQQSILPALRHRLIPNFEAEAEGITTDHVLHEIEAKVPRKVGVKTGSHR